MSCILQVEGFCLGGLTVTFYPLLIEYIGAGARNLANVVAQCGLVGAMYL